MERYTLRDTHGEAYVIDGFDAIITGPLIKKLAAYEDTGLSPERVAELAEAEKDGRLFISPVKEDDTAFILNGGVHEARVKHIGITLENGGYGYMRNFEHVYKTCTEAETALAQQGGEEAE